MAVIIDSESPKIINISAEHGRKNSYSVTWQVLSDSAMDGPVTILAATGLPQYGDAFSYGSDTDTSTTVKKRTAELVEERQPFVWRVVVTYEAAEGDADNPLLREPDVDWDMIEREKAFDKDLNGEGILNKAGDPFDPPVVDNDYILALNYTVNRAAGTYDPVIAKNYMRSVNADPFLGFDPNQARVAKWTGKRLRENGVAFDQHVFQFHFRETWDAEPLNAGRMQIAGSSKIKCLDDNGDPVNDPVPLDSAGGQIFNPTPASCIYLSFKILKPLPYATLGIVLP